MNSENKAATQGHGNFPLTAWSKLLAAKDATGTVQRDLFNFLIQRYWKPVYYYVRRRGYDETHAEDLVQDFFLLCVRKNLFAQADPNRGRFRNFLLGSLNHFLANAARDAAAKKRRPEAGFVAIHELASAEGHGVIADYETPDAAFEHAWISDLLTRVLKTFEEECRATRKEAHLELFRRRIVEPALEGATPPPLTELAQNLGITEKEAGNRLVTARRAYQRLLREEVRLYAASDEEVAAEVADLFHFLAQTRSGGC